MKPGVQTRRCQRGHTLLELVFVVAIIALLATMILPVLQGARSKALRTRFRRQTNEDAPELAPIDDDHRKDGAELDHDGEDRARRLEAQEVLEQQKMCRRGHR